MAKRTLAIGDVHGCFTAMQALLDAAQVTDEDHVVWLGDYVDRGPDSAKVVAFLMGLPEASNTCLRGNHEILMVNARRSVDHRRLWASVGGDATWDSYLAEYGGSGMESVPGSHWAFFDALKPYHETDTHLFVHGSLDSDVPPDEQSDDALYWNRFDSIGPHMSGKHIVCGHTSQKDGLPKTRPHATCIDTFAFGGGWLTCLDVATGEYVQANQAGETRRDWLEPT